MTLRKVFYCLIFATCLYCDCIEQNALANLPSPNQRESKETPVPEIIIRPQHTKALLENNALTPSHSLKTLITREQLNRVGTNSLSSALRDLGGVTLQDSVGNGSQTAISMRGFGTNASSNTLVLINGIPMSNPDLASANLNTIPVQAIELIEVIAGTESVLYGDQAVAGIVNITTRYDWREKMQVSCNAGSFNASSCYAWLSNHLATYGIDYYFSPLIKRTDNYRDNNAYEQQLISGGFSFGRGQLRFNYTIDGERMGFPGALTQAQVRQNRRQANNDQDFFRDTNGLYSLHYRTSLGGAWQSSLDLAYRALHGRGILYSEFSQSRVVQFFKPQFWTKYPLATIRLGGDGEKDDYQLNSLFGLTNERQQKLGLFGLATITLRENILLDVGGRGAELLQHLNSATTNDTVNRATATLIGGRLIIKRGLNAYLRRASSFRFPKADENANAAYGVKSLRTQRGISYEGGLEWQADQGTAKLGFYHLDLKDEIAFDPQQTPQAPFGANRNLSPTKRYGLTSAFSYPLFPNLTLDGQYNYVNARFRNGPTAGKRIPLVSEQIARLGMLFNIKEDWQFYGEAIYTGNQYAANDDANISGRIGGYTVYNCNFRYHWRQLFASFRVDNIFNKAYYYYTTYQSSTQSQYFYPAPERTLLFTLEYVMA